MVDTNEACKPSQRWILLVGLGFLVWTWLKTVCFGYDLGFEVQQLILNSQVITNNSQTPRDSPKQTPLNSTRLMMNRIIHVQIALQLDMVLAESMMNSK